MILISMRASCVSNLISIGCSVAANYRLVCTTQMTASNPTLTKRGGIRKLSRTAVYKKKQLYKKKKVAATKKVRFAIRPRNVAPADEGFRRASTVHNPELLAARSIFGERAHRACDRSHPSLVCRVETLLACARVALRTACRLVNAWPCHVHARLCSRIAI